MKDRPLTDRQKEILSFIRDWDQKHGYAPSLREIGAKLNVRSTNAVSDHLRALVRKGHIAFDPGIARSIRIVVSKDPAPSLPVAPPPPAPLPPEPREGCVQIHRSLFGLQEGQKTEIVEMPDSGLADRGIRQGDLLVVVLTGAVSPGAIVAARWRSSVTVRIIELGAKHVRLLACNKSGMYPPVMTSPNNISIRGVVAGFIRPLSQE